jgi:hypothetical protein
MDNMTYTPQQALKYRVEVTRDGRVELPVPFAPGDHATIFVVAEKGESFWELIHAAESSLDFWDNPEDDEDWNHANHN